MDAQHGDGGGTKSTARTQEQTDAVKFWTQLNIVPAWQEAARQISAAKGLSLAENTRLFALLNMGNANTFINDWDAKFTYNFWRPITAIRNGDIDGNDATERDPGWTSFNATPMHPEYPSQAAIVAGVSAAVLELVIPSAQSVPFAASDLLDPRVKRQFNNIAELEKEQSRCASGAESISEIRLKSAMTWVGRSLPIWWRTRSSHRNELAALEAPHRRL